MALTGHSHGWLFIYFIRRDFSDGFLTMRPSRSKQCVYRLLFFVARKKKTATYVELFFSLKSQLWRKEQQQQQRKRKKEKKRREERDRDRERSKLV